MLRLQIDGKYLKRYYDILGTPESRRRSSILEYNFRRKAQVLQENGEKEKGIEIQKIYDDWVENNGNFL